MLESLGHYKILEHIGSGGLGDVYRARDTRVGRTVAIKVLPEGFASAEESRARFLDDARRASKLSHPNLAALYEVAEGDGDGGRPYLACEFVEGQTLKALVGGRPLNPRRAVNLASQIADGLAEAHAADMAHGNLDAESVIVTSKGRAKVLDVGLAAWRTNRLTEAPAAGSRFARDISALGVLLFEMLTGAAPAQGARVSRVIGRAIPQELDPIMASALGEIGSYESVAVLASDLRAVGSLLDVRQEVSAAAAAPPVLARPTRTKKGPLVLGLALLALVLLAWWYFRVG